MTFVPCSGGSGRPARIGSWLIFFLYLVALAFPQMAMAGLPKRLVLLVDGVSYRDMKALQEGVTYKDIKGRQFHRQGFQQGYFPVSRNVSTFPSASDVAWTEILGDRPLPGYQRTYFSADEDSEIFINGVTTSMEYEKQMTWQMEGGFRRMMGYISPLRTFKYEVNKLVESFLNTSAGGENYYAMIHSTDSAQHLSGDIFAMLCALDQKLEELRGRYRAREGRELEVLMLSDHGNNHAGAGRRIAIRSFLRAAGYRITKSIRDPKAIVLPTAGIETWVEIHNAPAETERLVQLLSHLQGVDVLTAQFPGRANQFIVMNSKGERAIIEWNVAMNSFRYSLETGDPLGYCSVVESLAQKELLDSAGFATADAWMAESLAHHYPLALERIVRGHTQVTLNPASILISLDNDYVHCGWLIKRGVALATSGGTHGSLDDINSNGILLSSFGATKDTSTSRVAALYGGFKGLRDYRAQEQGAEWVTANSESMPVDGDSRVVPGEGLWLRIWTPAFTRLGLEVPVEVTVEPVRPSPAPIRRGDAKPSIAFKENWTFNRPRAPRGAYAYERIYGLPPGLTLEPQTLYRISGRIRDQERDRQIFRFTFRTDDQRLPKALGSSGPAGLAGK